jgi:alpha-galactosidase
MPVPDAGRGVTYSTWYAFAQDVSAATVEKELAVAARSGLSLAILDDGWQEYGSGRGYAGCGDWIPDPATFPNFGAHVERVHALGYRYCAWVAPLVVGPRSAAFDQWSSYAPRYEDGLKCHVLDPRHAAVRRHIVTMCSRVLTDYGFDGLKIDFLDSCMAYAGIAPTAGQDVDDVGAAMELLLAELRDELDRVRPDGALIEFRQPYVGPAIARFANLLRAGDCPADAVTNRIRAIDLRLTAVNAAVHSDPILWHDDAPVQTVARQLQASLFSVPQLSVRLSEASDAHRTTVAFWTAFWQANRDTLLQGDFEPGIPNALYPVVHASRGAECVIARYQPEPLSVDLGQWAQLHIVNSTNAETLILQVSGAAPVRIETWAAGGQPTESTDVEFGTGPHAIVIPPFGLATLLRR